MRAGHIEQDLVVVGELPNLGRRNRRAHLRENGERVRLLVLREVGEGDIDDFVAVVFRIERNNFVEARHHGLVGARDPGPVDS